ncbi:hypothetical protein P5W99_34885 [Paraburkholderia sp. A3BS-1L]|uniref:hypothetical protein n=1 Tax=Paraburkholderia sp. A3BS-1L TaxID=3028375 RepID=UPI003DA9FCCC
MHYKTKNPALKAGFVVIRIAKEVMLPGFWFAGILVVDANQLDMDFYLHDNTATPAMACAFGNVPENPSATSGCVASCPSTWSCSD